MSVDLSKIEPGDQLVIRVDVLSRNNGGLWVNCAGMHASNAMDATLAAIVSHTPKALAVGDAVRHRSGSHALTILHIANDCAWVRRTEVPEQKGAIWPLADLERDHG